MGITFCNRWYFKDTKNNTVKWPCVFKHNFFFYNIPIGSKGSWTACGNYLILWIKKSVVKELLCLALNHAASKTKLEQQAISWIPECLLPSLKMENIHV